MRVAIFGKMGTGKSTVARQLAVYGLEQKSLALALKIIANIKELPEDQWQKELEKWAKILLPDPVYSQPANWYKYYQEGGRQSWEGIPTREVLVDLWITDFYESESKRELYQRIGTDSGRFINPEIWINYFRRHLKEEQVVVDDLRFKNEEEALHDLGFVTVKLTMPEEVRQQRLLERDGFYEGGRQAHPSEVELEHVPGDLEIHNVGTEADLYTALVEGLIKVGGKA